MDEIVFKDYRDPFRAFNIHMSIICDLEQGDDWIEARKKWNGRK